MKTRAPFSMFLNVAISTLLFSQFVNAQTPPVTPTAPTSPTSPTPPVAPAAATPPAAPALVYKDGVVKVGNELKQSRGRITDVDKGDNGCYLTLRNEKNNEFIEVATFAFCTQKPPLKGKQVEMVYTMETIQAGDCYGDPKCKRTETVPVITAVKILD